MRTMALSSPGGPESVMIRTGKAEAEAAAVGKMSVESVTPCTSNLPSARATPQVTFMLVLVVDRSEVACIVEI